MSKSVKWRGTQKNQWHYGMVVAEDETRTVVEYSHSVPASNARAGRIMTLNKSKIRVREI